MNGHSVLIGLQWGDEGKAKIIDCLGSAFDVVARFNGGANAGHTSRATINGKELEFIFHLMPSGALHDKTHCVLGNGMVIDPLALVQEIADLESHGIEIRSRLHISSQAHVVLPHHKERDQIQEEGRKGQSLGTTRRGIGPAYEDKVRRAGIRMEEFRSSDVLNVAFHNRKDINVEPSIRESLLGFANEFGCYIRDISDLLHGWHNSGSKILFEGAQATFLDIDHGTYPYVSSSNSVAGGACTGCGVGPGIIGDVIGVAKAYLTRVGSGPFPTELTTIKASVSDQEIGEQLRERGREFGATTGRPRRIGWLDLVMLRKAVWINGVTTLALTKLDILDHLPSIGVCVGYLIDGQESRVMPSSYLELDKVEPIFEILPGWESSTEGIESFEQLPVNAQNYIKFIEREIQVPVKIVSTSPHRDHTIFR